MTTDLSLADLQAGFDARGIALPVAVVHAVAADLLDRVEDGAGRALDPHEVTIDPHGRARAPDGTGGDSVVNLVVAVLGAAAPPGARELVAAGGSEPRAISPERVRRLLRRSLSPPAPAREVRAWAESLRETPSDLPTLPPRKASAPLELEAAAEPERPPLEAPPAFEARPATRPRPEASPRERPLEASSPLKALDEEREAAPLSKSFDEEQEAAPSLKALEEELDQVDEKNPTDLLPAQPDVAPDDPRSAEAAKVAEAAGVVLADIVGQGEIRGSSPSGRPVVRHELPRSDPPVTVSSAPAARRSARPGNRGQDSILRPGDDRGWVVWGAVLAALAGAMYLLFFG